MRTVAFPFPAVLVTVLICLDPASAADAPTAKEVFQNAVKHQGRVDAEKIRDVHVSVTRASTQSRQDGILTTHRVQSDVWYRSADQAFRIKHWSRTETNERSERSVIGRKYFERGKKVIELKPGNELDAQSIQKVKEDRAHFENVLGLMLLGRLDTKETKFAFASDKPVTLAEDMPENEEFRACRPRALGETADF